jgi:hypothetical protein
MAKKGRARRAAGAAGRGARALGKWSVQGAKGSAAAGAAGVVTYVGMKMLCGNNKEGKPRFELAQKHLVATPIVIGVGGHFLKRKYQSLGAGVVGAAAALAALAYDQDRALKATQAANSSPGVNALTQPSDIGDALDSALEDAGALTLPGDIGETDMGVYDSSDAESLNA